MQNFIVLGYVPGTHIQINFTGWLAIAAGFYGLILLRILVRHRRSFYVMFLGLYARRVIHGQQLLALPAFE